MTAPPAKFLDLARSLQSMPRDVLDDEEYIAGLMHQAALETCCPCECAVFKAYAADMAFHAETFAAHLRNYAQAGASHSPQSPAASDSPTTEGSS